MNEEIAKAILDGRPVIFPVEGHSEAELEMMVSIAEVVLEVELTWGDVEGQPGKIFIQRRDAFEAENSTAC